MSTLRKLKRQIQKNNGSLTYKKVVAKKRGCTVKELNKTLERKRRMEGN